jgi:DNA ligase-1
MDNDNLDNDNLEVPRFMLAHKARSIDRTALAARGFWVSEKLDGWRAMWVAPHECFRSRGGKRLLVPRCMERSMAKRFPVTDVDGEFWCGRGSGPADVARLLGGSTQPSEAQFATSGMQFAAFDAAAEGRTFEQRHALLRERKQVDVPFLLVLDHAKLTDPGDLKKWLEHVKANKGEGLMLREPESAYEFGKRSRALLKLKTWME